MPRAAPAGAAHSRLQGAPSPTAAPARGSFLSSRLRQGGRPQTRPVHGRLRTELTQVHGTPQRGAWEAHNLGSGARPAWEPGPLAPRILQHEPAQGCPTPQALGASERVWAWPAPPLAGHSSSSGASGSGAFWEGSKQPWPRCYTGKDRALRLPRQNPGLPWLLQEAILKAV